MPSFKVKIKWNKELFKDVEVNTDDDPLVFKAQLFALTGVQPERQKVMVKGKTLQDNDWSNLKIENGAMVLMMGSREEDVPTEPVVKPVFVEDMNEAELATAMDLPAGLSNLGNTCYMNATVQCLKTVPELRNALRAFKGGLSLQGNSGNTAVPAQAITATLRDLYAEMDKGPSTAPITLLQVMHLAFPRFAERANGNYMQQDANECWTELVRMLQNKLPAQKLTGESAAAFSSFIDQYFGGVFDVEMKCVEAPDEPPTHSTESFLQLSCFISTEVKYMQSGLRLKLKEQITKHSPTLGRDAQYIRESKIKRLPAYLTVQFVRFFYKEKESVNAKVLKDIKFPIEFDAFELCSHELQQKLIPMRSRFKELDDKKALEGTDLKKVGPVGDSEKKDGKKEPYWFEDDVGSSNSGIYTLQAVLTHKGRSSSSGHYVAWVRQKNDHWLKCDDDQVLPVTSEEILKLSGGGDWHCAYVLLYGPRILETLIGEDTTSAMETETSTSTN